MANIIKFFVFWHDVNGRLPADHKESQVERPLPLQQLQTALNDPNNPIKDGGCFGSGKDGYLVIHSPDAAGVFSAMGRFMPSFEFDYSELLDVNDEVVKS